MGFRVCPAKELLTPENVHAKLYPQRPLHQPYGHSRPSEAVDRMGFETGNILEPSMGVGNFFWYLAGGMRNSRLYGVG